MTNAQMTPNRFGKWAHARRMLRFTQQHVNEGMTVYITSKLTVCKITKKNLAQVRATKSGFEIQSGKNWLDATWCKLSAK